MNEQVVLITGASSGIGREIALAFARAGATVGILARRADRLAGVAAAVAAAGGRAVPMVADVADEAALRCAVEQLVNEAGRLDVLVNNAGMGLFGRQPTAAEFDRIFAVNVRSVWQLSVLALPHLTATGGCIINLGSAAVDRPFPGELAYLASKGAVAALTRGMAAAWGPQGVRVNLIQPGVVESEFLTAAGIPAPVAAAMHEASVAQNALPAAGRPADVAAAALFLASEGARFVTGAMLHVDGGYALGTTQGGRR